MRFTPIKKIGGVACLSTLLFSTGTQAADDTQTSHSGSASVSDLAAFTLDNQSFTLGLGYEQTTYKTSRTNPLSHITTSTQLTDNGSPYPIVELTSSENVIKAWPMRIGSAVVGWNIKADAGIFDDNNQILNSALRGQNIGTRVSGGYLSLAPTIFLKLGPLFPGTELYMTGGLGIGPGLLKASGTASFAGTVNNVGSSSPDFAIYRVAYWEFQANHWYFRIFGNGLTSHGNATGSLETYGFGLAYRIDL